ncbi:MAG TPA: DedA family protein [Candidatus Paceibacterota bacterium]|nr:DedA family protein [Candidatus Paceibacterota bacterium]
MFQLIPFIKAAGYVGVGGLVFAESGLLFGFFFPGDSLLFTAGLLASQGYLNIFILLGVTFFSAVVGDSVGYAIGKKAGPKIFNKQESIWFHPSHVERANAFFEKYGSKAIVFARFVPVVRTFVPVIAGVGMMKYKKFFVSNVIGALLWAVGVVCAGFFLGQVFPNAEHYLLPIIIFIIVLSFLPALVHLWRDESARKQLVEMWKRMMSRKK